MDLSLIRKAWTVRQCSPDGDYSAWGGYQWRTSRAGAPALCCGDSPRDRPIGGSETRVDQSNTVKDITDSALADRYVGCTARESSLRPPGLARDGGGSISSFSGVLRPGDPAGAFSFRKPARGDATDLPRVDTPDPAVTVRPDLSDHALPTMRPLLPLL